MAMVSVAAAERQRAPMRDRSAKRGVDFSALGFPQARAEPDSLASLRELQLPATQLHELGADKCLVNSACIST
jgi:hypothetical protein